MSRLTVYRRVAGACVVAVAVAGGSSVAQPPPRSLAFDADSMSFDLATRAAVLENVRFTEGNVSISAAEGRRLAGDDVVEEWSLTGDVVITVDAAVARAESARVRFSSGRFVSGELVGAPVSIENPGADPFLGSANRIAYDAAAGVFSATGDASFSVGTQEVNCDWVYDVRQRIARGSGGQGGCRWLLRSRAP